MWELMLYPKGSMEGSLSIFLGNKNEFQMIAKFWVSILDSNIWKSKSWESDIQLFESIQNQTFMLIKGFLIDEQISLGILWRKRVKILSTRLEAPSRVPLPSVLLFDFIAMVCFISFHFSFHVSLFQVSYISY